MIASYKASDNIDEVMVKCVSVNSVDRKVNITDQKFKFSPDSKKIIEDSGRIYMTPTISDDKILFYVPMIWNKDTINNYIYALMYELKLIKREDKNAKTRESLKKQFTLELVLVHN